MIVDNQDSVGLQGTTLTKQGPSAVGAGPGAPGAGPTERLKSLVEGVEDRLVLLKGVIDVIEDPVALLDATGKILHANSKMAYGSGRGPDDVRGKSLDALSLIPAQAMSPALSLLGSVLSGQAVRPFRVDACGGSGETTPMEIHMTAVKRGERVIGVLVTGRSTPDRGGEAEVGRGGEDRYRHLVENAIDCVWEVNEKSVYTYVSASVRDILGYEPREVLGKTIYDLVPMGDVSRVMKTIGAAISAQQPLKLVQINCLRKDGRTVTLETSAVPMFNSTGRFSGYQGVHRDITGRGQTDHRFADDLVKLERTVDGIIQAMTLMVEVRDLYTAGHQKRVSQLGGAIVREMHSARARVPDLDKTVRVAGLLHDLGKVFIPVEILVKPGQLTQDELNAVKNHPRTGYEVLKNIAFPWPIADVVLQHHERMDGSGYPAGLKGDDIRIEARIIGVADVVEAMVHPRSYRPALDLDNALREIAKGKGILYDQEVVEACLTVFLDRGFKFQSE